MVKILPEPNFQVHEIKEIVLPNVIHQLAIVIAKFTKPSPADLCDKIICKTSKLCPL